MAENQNMALRADDFFFDIALKAVHHRKGGNQRGHADAHARHADKRGDERKEAFAFEHIADGDEVLEGHRYIVLKLEGVF